MNLLTHSAMSCYKSCPRRYYYAYIKTIRKERTSDPLRIGSAVHIGLDLLAQGKSTDDVCNAVRDQYADPPQWTLAEPDGQFEWDVECETVVRLLLGYAWRWGNDEFTTIDTEMEFNVPLLNPDTGRPSRTFRHAGKIDKRGKTADGRNAIREHKTTGDDISPDSDYWTRLRMDQQIGGYWLASIATGFVPDTIEYDVIRKPGIEPKLMPLTDTEGRKIVLDDDGRRAFKSNGEPYESSNAAKGLKLQQRRETPEEFGERLAADLAERPDFYFARHEIPRIESDIEDFRNELWQIAQQIGEATHKGRWYRNTDACLRPYKCEFFGPCSNGTYLLTEVPSGYIQLGTPHPELTGGQHNASSQTTRIAAATKPAAQGEPVAVTA